MAGSLIDGTQKRGLTPALPLVVARPSSDGPTGRGGSVIYRPPGEPNLKLVDYIPSDDHEQFALLVVEAV